jgi:hypothetical protein
MLSKKLVSYILKNNGITYDMKNGAIVTSGYSCAKEENEYIVDGKITDYDLLVYMLKYQKDLTRKNAMLGVWYNTENEKTYIDTSFVFENVDDAKRFGKENNQIAIFHLDTFTEIRL